MALRKLPSTPPVKPRAQVAYEGDDEFSAMSLHPARQAELKAKDQLLPGGPKAQEISEMKPMRETTWVTYLKKIFPR